MPSQAKVSRVSNTGIVVEHDDGTPETTHEVSIHAMIALNGRPAQLRDLKRGDELILGGNPVMHIHAVRPGMPMANAPQAPATGPDMSQLSDDDFRKELERRGLGPITPKPEEPKEEESPPEPEKVEGPLEDDAEPQFKEGDKVSYTRRGKRHEGVVTSFDEQHGIVHIKSDDRDNPHGIPVNLVEHR